MESGHWDLWEVSQFAALYFLWFGLAQFVRFVFGKGETRDQEVLVAVAFQTSLYAFFFILVQCFLWHKKISWNALFGFSKTKISDAFLTAGTCLMAILVPLGILNFGIHKIFDYMKWPLDQQLPVQLFLETKDPVALAALVGMAVVGAPLFEEILFRGILYPFLKGKIGLIHATWINAVVFAMAHGHIPSMLPLAVLGIVFTLLYEWKGNLAACMIMHSSFNTLSLFLLWTTKDLKNVI